MKKWYIIIVIGLTIIAYFGYLHQQNMNIVTVTRKVNSSNQFPSTLVFMTYNIHHGIGLDGKHDLDRIATLIKASGADIIGLNEVDSNLFRTKYRNQVQYLANKLDMNYVYGPVAKRGIGSYGNAILTRFPLGKVENYYLPVGEDSEQRGIIRAEVKITSHYSLQVFSTHLGVKVESRNKQIAELKEILASVKGPFILMGDFNTFLPSLAGYPSLIREKSFPADNPVEAIDLFFSSQGFQYIDGYTFKSSASDHLPVIIELKPLN